MCVSCGVKVITYILMACWSDLPHVLDCFIDKVSIVTVCVGVNRPIYQVVCGKCPLTVMGC